LFKNAGLSIHFSESLLLLHVFYVRNHKIKNITTVLVLLKSSVAKLHLFLT